MQKLAMVADLEISNFQTLCQALSKRMDHFAAHGCKISDHALDTVVYEEATEKELDTIFSKRLSGQVLTTKEVAQFKTAVLIFLGVE